MAAGTLPGMAHGKPGTVRMGLVLLRSPADGEDNNNAGQVVYCFNSRLLDSGYVVVSSPSATAATACYLLLKRGSRWSWNGYTVIHNPTVE